MTTKSPPRDTHRTGQAGTPAAARGRAPFRRARTLGVALVAMLGSVSTGALRADAAPVTVDGQPVNPTLTPNTSAVSGYGATITVVGKGNGHGDGMSQYGAYGYATLHDWDWHQILAHYYGGTTEATTEPAVSIAVKLRALDDQPYTALVSSTAKLTTNIPGAPAGVTYKSIVAIEGAETQYRVYGRTDTAVCPPTAVPAEFDQAGSGWTLLTASFTSTSANPAADLEISAAGVAANTTSLADLVGVCQPSDDSVRLHRGSILVLNGTANENRTVNKVPVDQYLRGVVPRESPASWGDGKGSNALAAQAVAARTYALTQARYTYAGTCDTDACQVYGAAARRTAADAALVVSEDARTDAAVAATAGIVLHKADNSLAFTQFNSSSGGFTSGANFPAVEDLGDAVPSNPYFRWTSTLQRAELEAAYPTVGSLLSIEVIKRNGLGEWGGRALKVAVRGTKATVEVTGEQFRSASGLRSAWFFLPSGCDGPAAAPVTMPTAITFHSMTPTRVVDTRTGLGASLAPVAPSCVLPVRVGSLVDLPTAATAVSVGVTVTNAATAGYVTVYPCQAGRPVASNVNYRAGQTVANQVVVALDGNDEICLFTSQKVDVVVDVLGWFGGIDGAQLAPLPPARILDTRTDVGGHPGVVPSTGTVSVDVFAAGGVPAGAKPTAVVVNLTSTGAAGEGFFAAYACDAPRPSTSNLNTSAGRDVAAHAVVAVSADGRICLYSNVSSHAIVDINGWYRTAPTVPAARLAVPAIPVIAGRFTSVAPVRLLDTRTTADGAVLGGHSVAIDPVVAGGLGKAVPGTVVVNVTATDAVAGGFLAVYPCGQDVPLASSLNYPARTDVANLVTVPVGADGKVCVFSNQTTHVVVDLAAWYS